MATNHSGASAGSVALAFLSGALLGAVTAIMLAPQPGRDSRERITGYARRTGEDLRDIKERATDAVEDVVGRGRELVEEISSAVREALDAGRDAMRREREMKSLD
ncbi:MAG: YtxH domain-containing protein [Nitrospirales bacterium]|nr:YtxH domain-containing protein [Nitrospira sp.]MDR4461229.1 YtxH domain-containing protein [Nitrospirales bacterium]MDR4482549.1 YtxH domain-containing protein [Nitrospirales bacterium]